MVLNENVFASYAFSSTYRDAGIFGLYGACVGGSQDSTLSALIYSPFNINSKGRGAFAAVFPLQL